jgi:cyclopropane fatty-acyl-phospholipid synthase-like methyltransferase
VTTAARPAPTIAQQVTKLYDLIAGYHATHLIEIARDLGAWAAVTAQPGITSTRLAQELGLDPYYTDALCRTAFAFELLDREGDGWRMAPLFDQILGDPAATFYLGKAARVHLVLGRDYADYPRRIRDGSRVTYQEHDETFMREVADALQTLPRIFVDLVLPTLPSVRDRLEAGARLLDVGCGAGWAIVQLAERFPKSRCVGVDIEPYSIELAKTRIAEHGLEDRCEGRLISAGQLAEEGAYDLATSFLVVHELLPEHKVDVFHAIARALGAGGSFVIFDETYPETDQALRTMPSRFAALAQWYELTWGNRVNTRTELHALCADAGLRITEETAFSRFYIGVATKS